jgi:uncharacterized membrane protein YkvA (DUF1232 family)
MLDMPTPRQVAAVTAVGRAVRSGTRPGSPGLVERVRLLPSMVRDAAAGRYPALSKGRITALALGVVYILSPIDLVPESLMLLVGMTDDVLVAGWVVAGLLDASGEYALWRRAVPTTATHVSSERTSSTVSASPAALSSR